MRGLFQPPPVVPRRLKETCETYRPPRPRSVRPCGTGGACGVRGGPDVDRIPRRPELPLGRGSRRSHRSLADRRTRRSCGCSFSGTSWRRHGPQGGGPVRSGVQLRRSRRRRPDGAGDGQEVHSLDLGTPRWANGGKSPNVMPGTPRRLHGVRESDRVALLRSLRRVSVRPLLVDLERAEPAAVPRAAVHRPGSRSLRPTTRGCTRPRIAGIKAGNPRRRSPSARRRHAGRDKPNGAPTDALTREVRRELVAKANPRLKFDAWSHHPYPFRPNRRRRRS